MSFIFHEAKSISTKKNLVTSNFQAKLRTHFNFKNCLINGRRIFRAAKTIPVPYVWTQPIKRGENKYNEGLGYCSVYRKRRTKTKQKQFLKKSVRNACRGNRTLHLRGLFLFCRQFRVNTSTNSIQGNLGLGLTLTFAKQNLIGRWHILSFIFHEAKRNKKIGTRVTCYLKFSGKTCLLRVAKNKHRG